MSGGIILECGTLGGFDLRQARWVDGFAVVVVSLGACLPTVLLAGITDERGGMHLDVITGLILVDPIEKVKYGWT